MDNKYLSVFVSGDDCLVLVLVVYKLIWCVKFDCFVGDYLVVILDVMYVFVDVVFVYVVVVVDV